MSAVRLSVWQHAELYFGSTEIYVSRTSHFREICAWFCVYCWTILWVCVGKWIPEWRSPVVENIVNAGGDADFTGLEQNLLWTYNLNLKEVGLKMIPENASNEK